MFAALGHLFNLVIVQPIFNILLAIYALIPGGDFGVAVIILTIIIRMLLYPLVKRQLHQSRMMRKLQPELKRIKKENKGDRQAEAQAMMELYKKHDVSPFRSFGILLIQLPVFIGLYQVVRIFTSHHDEIKEFTYGIFDHVSSIQHLIAFPDSLNLKLFGLFDLSKTATQGDIFLFVLAGLAAYTQYIISKQLMPHDKSTKKRTIRSIMREAAEGKQADQAEINTAMMGNMTKIMPFFMFFIMINLPGALALYYVESNLVAAAQQSYLLRKDADDMIEIADEITANTENKQQKTSAGNAPSAVERAKKAEKANITRIVAKDGKRRKS